MGRQFEDLPHWEFTIKELSPGIYNVLARRDGGVRGESTGPDPDTLLSDLSEWARTVEHDLR